MASTDKTDQTVTRDRNEALEGPQERPAAPHTPPAPHAAPETPSGPHSPQGEATTPNAPAPLSDERLNEIEARLNGEYLTAAPWDVEYDYCDCSEYGCGHGKFATAFGPFTWIESRDGAFTADAEFAAHAREDVPALLAEVRRQRTELDQYEMLSPQQCPAGKHADWLVDSEHAHACPWCRIAELEAYALGCDAEGCTTPHSSWCEAAKKTAAANNGCTCPQPWKDSPQPHAAYCWLVSPPRNEVEEMRRKVAEVIAGRNTAAVELGKAARKAITKAEAERDRARSTAVTLEQENARLENELAELRALHNRRLPRLLIKTAKDLDQYVGWSTVAEMPDGIWSRETALEAGIPRTWLDRADETGTSALYPEGSWDDSGFIAEQRGWLPRARLGDYAIEYLHGDRIAAYAMLEPFEDEQEAGQ